MTATPETRVVPPPGLIDRMCLTYRHDFGLMSEQEREGTRTIMRQLYEHDIAPHIAMLAAAPVAPVPHHVDGAALAIARQYTADNDPQRRAQLQVAIVEAIQRFSAAPAPEPVGCQYRIRAIGKYIGEWSEWREGKAPVLRVDYRYETEERPLYAAPPAPVAASAVDDWPGDGSCIRCGAVPRHPVSGLCNTCLDEDAERAGEIVASPLTPNPVAIHPAAETIVNAPRVRELVWSEIEQDRGDGGTDTTGEWEAPSIIGAYAINISTCGDMHAPWELWGGDTPDSKIGNFDTLEAAKAAAQYDYERRVLACLEPEQGWRDISSAPRDGTEILVYFPLDGLNKHWARRVPVVWTGSEWAHTGRSGGYSHAYQPTHWQPLPPPPTAEGGR